MKTLNIDYVRAFIEYGSINLPERKSFFSFIGGVAFIGLVPFGYSLILGNSFIDFCLASIVSIVSFSALAIASIRKKKTNKPLCLGIISLEGMINCTLLALVLLRMCVQNTWIAAFIIILPVFTALIFVFITIHFVKNGTYKNAKKANVSQIRYISMIFGLFGVYIARFFF